jgi:DNA polymerase-1
MPKNKEYKKSFFIEMNMQNPPKPNSMEWFVRKEKPDSIQHHTVCGYEFTIDKKEDSLGIAEGFSPHLNFREAFIPEEGHYWLSRDFSGQELRIMANLSKEKTWIDAFLNDEDIHKATAVAIWGKKNYNKELRKAAKAINFGLLYGTGAFSLSSQLNVTEIQAQEYIDKFFNALPKIKIYLDACAEYAKNYEEISNMYGRKRRLKSYVVTNWKGQKILLNSGKRKSYNFPIQSMGAEITKLALIRIYNRILINKKYKDIVYFMNTIHDEINLSVKKEYIKEISFEMDTQMSHTMKNMPVPIITSLEIGNSMGLTWKFKQNKETLELIPEYSPLEE